jgi:cytidylate kinase
MLRGPVVIKVIQKLDAAIKLVDEASESARATNRLDWVHDSGRKNVFEEVKARIRNRLPMVSHVQVEEK